MPIYEFEGKRPRIAASAFVHPTAVLIGDVIVGENVFILPNVSIRGEGAPIEIGAGTNIQDNCVLHAGAVLGRACHVGHGAIVHGAKVGENVQVGIASVILDGAELGDGCVVGAGAVVVPRMIVPPRKMLLGVPAVVKGDVSPAREEETRFGARAYEELGRRHAKGLREISREEATVDSKA